MITLLLSGVGGWLAPKRLLILPPWKEIMARLSGSHVHQQAQGNGSRKRLCLGCVLYIKIPPAKPIVDRR